MAKLIFTADILSAALEGFEVQRNRLDAQIAELRQMLNGNTTQRVASNGDLQPKRTVSAAARRRMAAAQQLRWKKVKQGTEPEIVAAKPRQKRSAPARKRMAMAQKKRWAAIKGKAVKSGPKKVAAVSARLRKVFVQKIHSRTKVVKTPEQAN